MAEADLSKIVSMILENPELVEKIKSMAEGEGGAEAAPVPENAEPAAETASYISQSAGSPRRSGRRNELLRAMKSFLSEDRRKSLDMMMTLADVFDTMKTN